MFKLSLIIAASVVIGVNCQQTVAGKRAALDAKCAEICRSTDRCETGTVAGPSKCLLKRAPGADGVSAYFLADAFAEDAVATRVPEHTGCQSACLAVPGGACPWSGCAGEGPAAVCVALGEVAPGQVCHFSQPDCQDKPALTCDAALGGDVDRKFFPGYPGYPAFQEYIPKKVRKEMKKRKEKEKQKKRVAYKAVKLAKKKKGLLLTGYKYDKKSKAYLKKAGYSTYLIKGKFNKRKNNFTFKKRKIMKTNKVKLDLKDKRNRKIFGRDVYSLVKLFKKNFKDARDGETTKGDDKGEKLFAEVKLKSKMKLSKATPSNKLYDGRVVHKAKRNWVYSETTKDGKTTRKFEKQDGDARPAYAGFITKKHKKNHLFFEKNPAPLGKFLEKYQKVISKLPYKKLREFLENRPVFRGFFEQAYGKNVLKKILDKKFKKGKKAFKKWRKGKLTKKVKKTKDEEKDKKKEDSA